MEQGAKERAIFRALLRSVRVHEEELAWLRCRFDPRWLEDELAGLAAAQGVEVDRSALTDYAETLSQRYEIRVLRRDDVTFSVGGVQPGLPRWVLGEALGALGANLFPSRQRALRAAIESARELVYFGCGPLDKQVATDPMHTAAALLFGPSDAGEGGAVVFRDLRAERARRATAEEMLALDRYFSRSLSGEGAIEAFQRRLREDPIDGAVVERLRDYFSRRATVGVRDAARWLLGSRHPWFDWPRARTLISQAFAAWGQESFLAPRLIAYGYDVSVTEEEISRVGEENQRTVAALAAELRRGLGPIAESLPAETLPFLAAEALDAHHDHPDFDVESEGSQSGEIHAAFLGHSLWSSMRAGVAGAEWTPRRNFNIAAHLVASGADRCLAHLSAEAQETLWAVLTRTIRLYARGGLTDGLGRPYVYRRLPCTVVSFQDFGGPLPNAGEAVVDTFSLSDLSAPQHGVHLRDNPEIISKLVVFFTLVLRHYVDTQHVPDLRPRRWARDFMLLGLWGTNTPNLMVNIYQNQEGTRRSEICFVGKSQLRSYRLEVDHKHEAALARLVVSQLGPLLEPSVLRALATFVMAAEEQAQGAREQSLDGVDIAKYGLDVFREAARVAVKGTLVDTATVFELLLDRTVDFAQRKVEHAGELSASWKKWRQR